MLAWTNLPADDLLVAMQKEPGKDPDPLLWRSINCLQSAEQEELL